jgi:hypothetical protein
MTNRAQVETNTKGRAEAKADIELNPGFVLDCLVQVKSE